MLAVLFIMCMLSFVCSLDYVKPDVQDQEYFINLVPYKTYTVSFLNKEAGQPVIIDNLICSGALICSAPESEGPYYNISVSSLFEGSYDFILTYSVENVKKTDERKILVSYDLIKIEPIIETYQSYLTKSNMRLIVQNNSDVTINPKISSNLSEESFPIVGATLSPQTQKVLDIEFIPMKKGTYDLIIYFSENGARLEAFRKSINSEYTLNDLFAETNHSYHILSPTTHIFSSIRAILSLFG